MRIILDVQIRRPNRELADALDEIRRRHDISGPGGDHETYDIAMAALQPRHRWRFWRQKKPQAAPVEREAAEAREGTGS